MRKWLTRLYGVTLLPHEAATARQGFTAFAFVLSSYFILLPLREDVALTLGPSVLPQLFTASLVVTALVAPLVTAYVVYPGSGSGMAAAGASRANGFRRLCRVMAGCLVVLWALLLVTSPDPWGITRLLAPLRPTGGALHGPDRGGGDVLRHHHRHLQVSDSSSSGEASQPNMGPPPLLPPSEQQEAQQLSRYGDAVRVCFYVYLSLQSILATSTLWAVCADTFTAATSTRVYGFLGAGATLGQLVASAAAFGFGTVCRRSGAAGAAVWLLLPSAGMLLAAARACQAMTRKAEAAALLPYSDGDPATTTTTATVAVTATAATAGGGGADGVPVHGGGSYHHQHSGPNISSGGPADVSSRTRSHSFSPPPPPAAAAGPRPRLSAALRSHASRLFEGFRLIAASPYLLAATAFLALHTSTSATLYFLRAAIVSRAPWLAGTDQRMAFFAALNTASAGVIFVTQMTVTGRVLTSLGVGPTLMVGPAVSLAGMAVIGLAPSAANIAAVEVVRKVVQYSLARPCREALFTVVSRPEKYGSKVVLDTVVQRAGDTAAAALFEVLAVRLALGPSAVAAAGVVLCVVHLGVAATLGRMYGSRKAAAALAAKRHQQQLHVL